MSTNIPISRDSMVDFLIYLQQNQRAQETPSSQAVASSSEPTQQVLPDSSDDSSNNMSHKLSAGMVSSSYPNVHDNATDAGAMSMTMGMSGDRSFLEGALSQLGDRGLLSPDSSFITQRLPSDPPPPPYQISGQPCRRPIARMSSADAKIDEFLNNLGNDNLSVRSSGMELLSESDPQSVELNKIVRELERIQESDTHFAPAAEPPIYSSSNNQLLQAELLKPAVPMSGHRPSINSDPAGILPGASNPPERKSHPTLTGLLIHDTRDNAKEIPLPLKDRPFQPTGDIEGRLLLLKNSQKQNVLPFHSPKPGIKTEPITDLPLLPLKKAQSLGDINANLTASLSMVDKPPNIMLGQGTLISSGSMGNSFPQEPMPHQERLSYQQQRSNPIPIMSAIRPAPDPDIIIIDEPPPRQQLLASPPHRVQCFPGTEDKLQAAIIHNRRLSAANMQLQRESVLLRKELTKKKKVPTATLR